MVDSKNNPNTETQKHRNTETQKHRNTASLCYRCVIAGLSLCYRCVIAVLSLEDWHKTRIYFFTFCQRKHSKAELCLRFEEKIIEETSFYFLQSDANFLHFHEYVDHGKVTPHYDAIHDSWILHVICFYSSLQF